MVRARRMLRKHCSWFMVHGKNYDSGLTTQSFILALIMIKYAALVMLLIFSISIAFPASASVCRNYNGHQICILSIKRSAKNYWEYRAAVSVDGVAQATKVYNCRQQLNLSDLPANRLKVQQDETALLLGDSDSGKFICSFFK